jgi:hypothetical protein
MAKAAGDPAEDIARLRGLLTQYFSSHALYAAAALDVAGVRVPDRNAVEPDRSAAELKGYFGASASGLSTRVGVPSRKASTFSTDSR